MEIFSKFPIHNARHIYWALLMRITKKSSWSDVSDRQSGIFWQFPFTCSFVVYFPSVVFIIVSVSDTHRAKRGGRNIITKNSCLLKTKTSNIKTQKKISFVRNIPIIVIQFWWLINCLTKVSACECGVRVFLLIFYLWINAFLMQINTEQK